MKRPVLLTVPQVAEQLQIPAGQVRTLIRRRELPAVNVAAGKRVIYRVRPSDLEKYLQARTTLTA